MRTPLLLITLALLASCSDESQPQASASPPVAQSAKAKQPPPEKADVAAAEAAEQEVDPCDLSGYDMSKMTVDLHEDLVKACNASKQ
jgi:hypothetical protein